MVEAIIFKDIVDFIFISAFDRSLGFHIRLISYFHFLFVLEFDSFLFIFFVLEILKKKKNYLGSATSYP